jgi:type II secretory pathway component HofQ
MRLALALMLAARAAHADNLCATGVEHRGATIDLDLDQARVRAALQLVANTAHLSLVVGEDVTGTVTLHLARVPWDAAACAIANVARLELELRDGILIA